MRYRFLFFFLVLATLLQAQIPANYYVSAYHLKGYALRVALHNIITEHTALSYANLWTAFQTTDKRPDGKVWDIYSDIPTGTPAYLFTFVDDQCGNYSAEGDCYNREHSVPKSWFNEETPMYTDLFHLYPTDGYVNNRRGNYPLGEVDSPTWTSTNGSKVGTCTAAGYSGSAFEPIDSFKGDLARTCFYMSVCYMDRNLGYETQSMFENGSLKPWALAMLLTWHHLDTVSQKEIDRNNAVYNLQHNRNPFIDYPELADKIFGSDSINEFNPEGNGISELENPEKWTVFPNPTDAQLMIMPFEIPDNSLKIEVLNVTGQVVLSEEQLPQSIYQLNVSGLKSGIYILHIQADNFNMNHKIIIR